MMPFCDLRPHLASPFSPRATTNGILLFSFAFPVCRVPFRPSQPERNFILTLHILRPRAIFTLEKHQRELFFLASPICRGPFYPRAVPNGILFSHSTSIPLRRGPRLQRCITIFSVLSAAFHHAGHRVSQHAEYIQRSCPKCVAQHRNGEIFPPANATAATNRGAGTAIQDEYKKKLYPSARRGIYYTGIIGGGRGGRGYIIGDYRQGKE